MADRRLSGHLPYYTQPSQDGLFQHFLALAGRTERPIIVDNIALKYWLWREGLIDSPDVRLPMMDASPELRDYLDTVIDRNRARAAE